MSGEVRISPTRREDGGGSENGSDDHWTLEGFDLKSALSRVCDFPETRIELPASLDTDDRYDFVLVPPGQESHDSRNHLMREGIEKHFRVRITHDIRPMDVYVLTAPDGPAPALRYSGEAAGGGIGAIGLTLAESGVDGSEESLRARFRNAARWRQSVSSGSIAGMSASGATMGELCRMLERGVDRPVVDETHLAGRYDLQVGGAARSTDEFLRTLREQAGLTLTPARRNVTMLVAVGEARDRTDV